MASSTFQNDWKNWWETSSPGQSINYAGGILTRRDPATSVFRNAQGVETPFAQQTGFGELAKTSPELSSYWKNTYGYDATAPGVPEEATTSFQLNKLLSDQSSPLLARAKQLGMEYANERGLLNTSLGAQASTRALIDAALPIAVSNAQPFVNQANITAQQRANSLLGSEAEMRSLRSGYLDRLSNTQDWTQGMIANIQASTMDDASKQASISVINNTSKNILDNINQMYSKLPNWQTAWQSVFSVKP